MNFLRMVIAGALIASCASPPPVRKPILRSEAVRIDREIGEPLSRKVEETTSLISNVDVTIYLRKIAERLMPSVQILRDSPIGVFLLKDQGGPWMAYGIPGTRIYFPIGSLKYFRNEGEIAAFLSLEFAHLSYRVVTEKVEEGIQGKPGSRPEAIEAFLELPGFKSLFILSPVEFLRSVRKAMSILYAGGYDPRVMITFLELWLENPSRSPQSVESLQDSIREAKQLASTFPPILNPALDSDEFIKNRKIFKTL